MTAAIKEGRQGDLFTEAWLPYRPYAADEFATGVHQMQRERALTKRHIQANPPALSNLLVVDIDHNDAVFRALHDRRGWQPNWVAENPANGHAHAIWAIAEPVVRTEYRRRKPLAFADDVTEGLRRSVDGDMSYGGFMMKNPVHESWETFAGPDHLYELGELAEHLRDAGFMPPYGWRKRVKYEPTGLGRNCTLFETVRQWAYPEINNHWGDPNGLGEAIEIAALQINADKFKDPLPTAEVIACARSITRWIVRKSDMWKNGKEASDKRFKERQAHRGRQGAKSRWGDTESWKQQALAIIAEDES